jgi:hypothetical protein
MAPISAHELGFGAALLSALLALDPAKNFVVIMKDGKIYKNVIR